MEQNCKFVSSRGLLKSTTFRSDNPISSYPNDYNYLLTMIQSKKMFGGMSIYVCSDLLSFFVQEILPKIKHKFYLLSGDSDMVAPLECLTESNYLQLLNNTFLIKWFSQNNIVSNCEKIIQMPIGLDYHTISNNPNFHWRIHNEGISPIDQEAILLNIKKNSLPFYERNIKIFVNFNMNNDKFHQRKMVFEEVPPELMIINMNFQPRTIIWKKISENAFVISPFGMGMDCHRTWETLSLGSIPIVLESPFTQLFEDLPVLIVQKWSDINIDLLNRTIKDFQTRKFNFNKLELKYWTNLFSTK